ncbi:glycosyltransferase [Coleofasciculus sp. G2-EDA-02]|uniref:glycosyltransferase n=1 Tax=Coleofasciculus sp. G2-EDA-02 TaxID=3069529 RepID=UPI0032F1327F
MSKYLKSLPQLSLCMIVKNEIDNLPRCLSSAKPYVDEIIVVDTGSNDRTPELATEYGAIVSYFEWCDDFAAARNYAISQASGDWILMLDADDELVVESDNFKEEMTKNPETIAYSLTYIEVDDQTTMTPLHRLSLFRNLPDLRYVGRFHELLRYLNPDKKLTQISHLDSLKVLHHGYSKENVHYKDLNRNIPILERIRQQEGLSLKLLFCLAGMYADTQQPEKAQNCYAEVFDRLLPNLIEGTPPDDLGFVPVILFTLGMNSLDQTDYETVRLLCPRGLEWCPNYPPLNFLAGLTLKALGFPLGAIAYFQTCLRLGKEASYTHGQPFEVNYITTYPAYELGCAYLELKQNQDALAAFQLALSFNANYAKAKQQINKIQQELGLQS